MSKSTFNLKFLFFAKALFFSIAFVNAQSTDLAYHKKNVLTIENGGKLQLQNFDSVPTNEKGQIRLLKSGNDITITIEPKSDSLGIFGTHKAQLLNEYEFGFSFVTKINNQFHIFEYYQDQYIKCSSSYKQNKQKVIIYYLEKSI